MMRSDWVTEAAERIYIEQQRSLKGDRPSHSRIVSIIREHCPFKQDVAYAELVHVKLQPRPYILEDDE